MHLDLHHKRAQEATVKVDWKVLFYWTGLATVVYNIVVFGKESDPTDTLADALVGTSPTLPTHYRRVGRHIRNLSTDDGDTRDDA